MNIMQRLRLMQVKRYPISHTNRDQSVAEHSYNVMLIAMDLIEGMHDDELFVEVMGYALAHDLDEVFTGDIPSTFKRHLRAQCPAVIPVLDGTAFKPNEQVRAIVKCADYLEAIYYLREFGGSRSATGDVLPDIVQNFHEFINAAKLPEAVVERAKWLFDRL